MELTGLPEAPGDDTVTGIVIGTDIPRTGKFSCSNAVVNQLQSNIQWSMRQLSLRAHRLPATLRAAGLDGRCRALRPHGGLQRGRRSLLHQVDVARPEDNHTVILEFRVDDVDEEFKKLSDTIKATLVQAPTTMPWAIVHFCSLTRMETW